MIRITSFDQQNKPIVSANVSQPEEAAGIASALAPQAKFLKLEEGNWKLVFPAAVRVAKDRLAHIIQFHADVVIN